MCVSKSKRKTQSKCVCIRVRVRKGVYEINRVCVRVSEIVKEGKNQIVCVWKRENKKV